MCLSSKMGSINIVFLETFRNMRMIATRYNTDTEVSKDVINRFTINYCFFQKFFGIFTFSNFSHNIIFPLAYFPIACLNTETCPNKQIALFKQVTVGEGIGPSRLLHPTVFKTACHH